MNISRTGMRASREMSAKFDMKASVVSLEHKHLAAGKERDESTATVPVISLCHSLCAPEVGPGLAGTRLICC